MLGRLGDNSLVLLATLLINLLLFLSIPLLSRMQAEPRNSEPMTRPTVVSFQRLEQEPEKKKQERQRDMEQEEPKTLPEEPSLRRPRPKSQPRAELRLDAPRFELSELEVGSVEVEPPPERPEPAPQQPTGPAKSTFRLGEVDQRPRLMSRVRPVYPYWARQQEITGKVVLKFLVNEKGEVEQVTVVESDPEGVFEESAKSAVRSWQFEPGRVQGEKVKTWVTVPISFTLSD
jgi:protein TonB